MRPPFVLQEHPDQSRSAESHERFVKIGEAYNVLSKESSRQQYDLTLDGRATMYAPPPGPSQAGPHSYRSHHQGGFSYTRQDEQEPFMGKDRHYFYQRFVKTILHNPVVAP